MKIAACLILKNSEATIEQCLDSIRPFVDEVNVYDTGSTDGTLQKLNELDLSRFAAVNEDGTLESCPPSFDPEKLVDDDPLRLRLVALAPIRVEQGEWRDDFSWAREQSFAMCSDDVEWTVWADDDDVILGAQMLRHLVASAPPGLHGFTMFYDYAQDEFGNCVCQLWRERLMRRSAGYTWRNAVHEVQMPPEGVEAALAAVPPEQIRYVHRRPPDRYSPDRNMKILQAEVARVEAAGETVEPRTLAYLGTEQMAHGKLAEAVPFLQAYLEHPSAGWSDERMQVHHKLAACFRSLGNPHAAVHVEFEAHKERDDWAEVACGLAESFALLGQWNRVEHWAKIALDKGMPQSMLILNPLEFTFLPRMRLAEACASQGRLDEATRWLNEAAQIMPGHAYVETKRAEFERAAFEGDVAAALLKLREVLVRYDENEKAYRLMEHAVPYVVAEHPLVVKARADQREMVKHLTHPEEYARWYTDEPKESSLTDEHIDLVGDWFGRVGGLLAGLREQEEELGYPPRLLDLGCNDFWMGEFFWRQGIPCDGVELNRRSFDLALERKERFGRDEAVIVHGDLHEAGRLLARCPCGDTRITEYERGWWQCENSGHRHRGEWIVPQYDAVSLFEVLEHVPDVEKTLEVLESLVRPGGRVYISTPDGAFENGNIADWANVVRKGHLRAIPIRDLAGMLNARGTVHALERTNGDRVAFAAYTPTAKKGKIVFYAGGSWEPWSPRSISEGGLGGSETALVYVTLGLAQAGYDVTVYSGAEVGFVGGVLYRPFTAWDPTEECDLLVVSRLVHVFDNPLGAKRTALWCHDHSYPGALTPERATKMDEIVCLTEWQRDRFARLYPFTQEKLTIIRNGIAFESLGEPRFADADRTFEERKPRCVYSSSADRGLDTMLELWPRIRAEVPDAELHVFYGWEVFDRVALTNPGLHAYKQRVYSLVAECGGEEGGVFMRGRLGQRELAEEMMQARVWSYPTAFLETSCIGAMEAQAAGLALVTSDLGALKETVGEHGIRVPWGEDEDVPYNTYQTYKADFVEAVVLLLTTEYEWIDWHLNARSWVERLAWSERIADWEALVHSSAVPQKVAA